jgi:ABC-2 type transport system ATP-binding protein
MRSLRTVEEDSGAPRAAPTPAPAGKAPVVIEARGLAKSFRVPEHRIDTIKERVTHPLTRIEYRELPALRSVSFDVHKGEFFGIVGQNGSGKSTLLKVLASIYRADAGTIRMAGRLAPFIELGVGFNPELTARENNEINGVLMGLSRREARRRLDAVLEFAELQDFAELKLKNYSSGMLVRLAFAVMVQADADIMLIDEVLAVGDVAFAQKCMDVFHEKRRAGKTIVLVTHDMGTVQSLCHRAMLMHGGQLDYIGDPEETAMRYYRLNFAGGEGRATDNGEGERTAVPDINARLVHARLENESGQRIENVEQGAPIVLDVLLEARRDLVAPIFVIQVMNADSVVVFGFTRTLNDRQRDRIAAGERVRLSGRIENSLVPGRYSVDCWVRRDRDQGDMAVQGLRLLDFVVYGTAPRQGVVSVRTDVEAVSERGPGP